MASVNLALMNELLTVKQVAQQYGVTRQAVMYWIKVGHLTAIRPTAPVGIRTIWLVEKEALKGFAPPSAGKWSNGRAAAFEAAR